MRVGVVAVDVDRAVSARLTVVMTIGSRSRGDVEDLPHEGEALAEEVPVIVRAPAAAEPMHGAHRRVFATRR